MSNYKSYYLRSVGLSEDSTIGGKGDNLATSDVDQTQLKMGIKVEFEHTKDPDLAKQIAMDHLAEDPQYYTHLKNAGMADEIPGEKQLPNPPRMANLMSPTAISMPVIGVAVRGTRSGGLPAGGRVDDPEKSAMGGFEKVTLTKLPQGGIKSNTVSARLGGTGLELVKNVKPNSQGAIADTPTSSTISANGGHFTPDNQAITRGKAPETNVKGSDAIHPHQVQQLGNPPFEDDGTNQEGETAEPKPEVGPWGIELGDETDKEDTKDASIDIRETLQAAQANVLPAPAVQEGWAQGEYTPEQQQALALLMKRGFREVSTFPAEPDADGGNMGEQVVIVVQKKNGPMRLSGEIEPNGLVNGQPVQQFLSAQMEECGTMQNRFQQLANIKTECGTCGCERPNTVHDDGALAKLREAVNAAKAKGINSPSLAKAERYLAEQGQ